MPHLPEPDSRVSRRSLLTRAAGSGMGIAYTIVAQSGATRLESGELTPDDPDGMACFIRHGGNGSVLVNNHEISGSEPNSVPAIPGFVYDPKARGGTTTIEVD